MTDPEDNSPFPEPVAIPITDSIDLHYFRAAEIGDVVDAYLEAALEAGFRPALHCTSPSVSYPSLPPPSSSPRASRRWRRGGGAKEFSMNRAVGEARS